MDQNGGCELANPVEPTQSHDIPQGTRTQYTEGCRRYTSCVSRGGGHIQMGQACFHLLGRIQKW